MDDNSLNQDGLRVWRLLVGVLVGVASTVGVYGIIYLYTITGYCVNCTLPQTLQTLLFFLGATLGAVGMGALAGRTAGKLEVPVAIGSGVAGLVILGLLPDSFADPVIVLFGAIPFLLFAAVGGMLVFFARRTDLR
jgi:hypothetical protein